MLVLAACGSSDDAGGDSTTTTHTPETTVEESPDTTDAPEQTTTTEAVTTTAPAAAGGSSCIEGQWNFGSDTFVEVMNSMISDTEMGDAEVLPTDGTYLVTFEPDGTFTGERDDWGFSVVSSEGTFVVSIDGSETGTWSADASTVTVSVASSDVVVTARAEVDGQTITLPNSPVAVPETIAQASAYDCTSDTLTVTTDEFAFVLDRA